MSLPFPIDGRPYSRDKAERDAERQRVAEFMLAEARRQATVAGLSSKCAGYLRPRPEHADGFGGCRNDGSTCLCECHDVPSRAQPEETPK